MPPQVSLQRQTRWVPTSGAKLGLPLFEGVGCRGCQARKSNRTELAKRPCLKDVVCDRKVPSQLLEHYVIASAARPGMLLS